MIKFSISEKVSYRVDDKVYILYWLDLENLFAEEYTISEIIFRPYSFVSRFTYILSGFHNNSGYGMTEAELFGSIDEIFEKSKIAAFLPSL